MKKKRLLTKILYNLAWWIIHRIDDEARDVGDTFRWRNMVFYVREFELSKFYSGPSKAVLTLEEFRIKDIINPETYRKETEKKRITAEGREDDEADI